MVENWFNVNFSFLVFLVVAWNTSLLGCVFQILTDLTKHMNETIVTEYGLKQYVTDSWDFVQYEVNCRITEFYFLILFSILISINLVYDKLIYMSTIDYYNRICCFLNSKS